MRWFSISSERKFRRISSAPSSSVPSACCFSLRREVGREEEHGQLAVLVQRVGELAELLAQLVQPAALAGDLEQRAAVDLGELLHQLLWAPPAPGGQAGEVEFAERLLHEAPLVGVVERLARDLLGGHDREVGDLAADVVERALGGGVDVALGALGRLGEDLLPAVAGLVLVRLGRLARALDDLLRLGPGLLQALAVFGEQLVGLGARALGRVDRLVDAARRVRRALADAREDGLDEDVERDREDDERPDHQADVGRDQPRVARGDRRAQNGGEGLHRPRGRRR